MMGNMACVKREEEVVSQFRRLSSVGGMTSGTRVEPESAWGRQETARKGGRGREAGRTLGWGQDGFSVFLSGPRLIICWENFIWKVCSGHFWAKVPSLAMSHQDPRYRGFSLWQEVGAKVCPSLSVTQMSLCINLMETFPTPKLGLGGSVLWKKAAGTSWHLLYAT